MENKNLNNSIESLQENQNTGKEQHNQLAQYLRTSWMVQVVGIPYQNGKNSIELIVGLAAMQI